MASSVPPSRRQQVPSSTTDGTKMKQTSIILPSCSFLHDVTVPLRAGRTRLVLYVSLTNVVRCTRRTMYPSAQALGKPSTLNAIIPVSQNVQWNHTYQLSSRK